MTGIAWSEKHRQVQVTLLLILLQRFHGDLNRDRSGQVHFLRLVEADETKPAIGDTKIPLLCPEHRLIESEANWRWSKTYTYFYGYPFAHFSDRICWSDQAMPSIQRQLDRPRSASQLYLGSGRAGACRSRGHPASASQKPTRACMIRALEPQATVRVLTLGAGRPSAKVGINYQRTYRSATPVRIYKRIKLHQSARYPY
jgi:hypothetical protein